MIGCKQQSHHKIARRKSKHQELDSHIQPLLLLLQSLLTVRSSTSTTGSGTASFFQLHIQPLLLLLQLLLTTADVAAAGAAATIEAETATTARRVEVNFILIFGIEDG